ncbi:MAG: transcriptional regulator [Myxococcales bacterium]|nr:transcriptional regulator [Myxococcales bacterium]
MASPRGPQGRRAGVGTRREVEDVPAPSSASGRPSTRIAWPADRAPDRGPASQRSVEPFGERALPDRPSRAPPDRPSLRGNLPGRPGGKFTQHRRIDVMRQLLLQHPKGLTLYELSERLRVTPRSLRRYLSEVRRGLDLEPTRERGSGPTRWRVAPSEMPRRVALRRTQAYALLGARRLFEPLRGSSLYEEIDLVVQRLLGVARLPGRGPNAGLGDAGLEDRFLYLPFAPKDYGDQVDAVDELFQAVANNRPLGCRYPRAEDGALERLVVHPYAMVLYKDEVFCLGRNVGAGEVQALALDRMRDVAPTDDPPFELPRRFSLESYCQGQFGLWRAREEHVVAIDFDPRVADYVRSRRLHPSQRVEPLGGGGVRLHLRMGGLAELTTWVLGFGALARVVAPPELRSRVLEELGRAVAAYADAPVPGAPPAPTPPARAPRKPRRTPRT